MMTIGDRIKQLRRKNSLTQDDLAEKLSTTKQTIHKYENNIITNIPADKIESLALAPVSYTHLDVYKRQA